MDAKEGQKLTTRESRFMHLHRQLSFPNQISPIELRQGSAKEQSSNETKGFGKRRALKVNERTVKRG